MFAILYDFFFFGQELKEQFHVYPCIDLLLEVDMRFRKNLESTF